jgi:drug/metabolite transporter (DMT)-like permease
MLFAATSVWGGSFVAMKALGLKQQQLIPGAGTWFVASLSLLLRFGVSTVLIALWAGRALSKPSRAEFWQGAGLGIFGGLGILFQMDAVQHTAASTSAFLTQCYCVLIPVVLALHHWKIPRKSLIACCLMVLTGVAILGNVDWQKFRLGRGEMESIFGSILFTGQILWLERPVFKSNRIPVATFYMFAITTLVVLPVTVVTTAAPGQWVAAYNSPPAIWLILFLILPGTLGTYTIMNYWQPHLPATQAGLIYCCEPVFTSVLALFVPAWLSAQCGVDYPNEMMTTRLLLGGGLITAANLLAMFSNAAAEKKSRSES